jgi:hypothetical protein
MELNVAVKFQRSPAGAGARVGDGDVVGAVGGAENELVQPARMGVRTARTAAIL